MSNMNLYLIILQDIYTEDQEPYFIIINRALTPEHKEALNNLPKEYGKDMEKYGEDFSYSFDNEGMIEYISDTLENWGYIEIYYDRHDRVIGI